MRVLLTKAKRILCIAGLFYLSPKRRLAVERRLRGRDDCRLLGRSDAAIVSFGKSGRTWLRVMLSRYFQVSFDLPRHMLIGYDNMHRRDARVPKLFFTHDNYLKDYTGHCDSKQDYFDHKVVLLVRHPADIAVSQYYQWRYRMTPHKKRLNGYPAHGADVSLIDFVMGEQAGLPKIIGFLNLWADAASRMRDLLIVRYEDMRAAPARELARVVGFLGMPASDEAIRDAVAFAAFENMKGLEHKGLFRFAGRRMRPGDRANPDSYKVRRAKVGGYRDYFSDEQVRAIDGLIERTLSERFGYQSCTTPAQPPAVLTA
ncbi:MAG: sulfotransferase [Gammaproteobacteria bacterium]|nr:sulfotransferase [Gammaproteobacteria bacterium]